MLLSCVWSCNGIIIYTIAIACSSHACGPCNGIIIYTIAIACSSHACGPCNGIIIYPLMHVVHVMV